MKKAITVIVQCATIIYSTCCLQPALAQYGQGFLSGIYQSGAKSAADAMRNYYKEHRQLPRSTTELDDVLCNVYAEINGGPPNLIATPITTYNDYRVLGSLMIKYDPTVANAPVELWRKNPPENWMVPGGKIVILSDGNSEFINWCATINGAPMLDENNHCIFTVGSLAPAGTP
ncbi:MAG: hypothetical protein P4L53_11140 [Candidatus Obscuribacterales bacterium]|nr:hypothetical protein [Candidatus Obscuribacterales bacterium]